MLACVLVALGAGLQLSGLNATVFAWAHAQARLPETLWSLATTLGFGWVVVIGVLSLDRGQGLATALLLRVLVLATLVTHLPKTLLPVARPLAALPPEAVLLIGAPVRHSGSMPSGHALAVGAALALLWILRPGLWRTRPACSAVVVTIAAMAVWSRVAVGAHWPADVMVGAGLGIVCALAAAAHEHHRPWAPRFSTPRAQRWIALLELVAAGAWLSTNTGYPQAVLLQWLISSFAAASALWRLRCARSSEAASIDADSTKGSTCS